MKTLKRIALLLVPVLYLSSCYVGVEAEHHRHYDDDRWHHEHHDHDHDEHHDHDDHRDNR